MWVHCPRASNGLLPRRSNLVGYVRWDAQSDRFPPCQTIIPTAFRSQSELPVIRECLQSVLTSLLAATNRRNRRQFYEKTVSPPFGHRDQAGEVDLVLQYCWIATGSGDNENNRRGDRLPFRRPACGHKRSSNQRN